MSRIRPMTLLAPVLLLLGYGLVFDGRYLAAAAVFFAAVIIAGIGLVTSDE